jgi:hypothetical protein
MNAFEIARRLRRDAFKVSPLCGEYENTRDPSLAVFAPRFGRLAGAGPEGRAGIPNSVRVLEKAELRC